MPGHKDKPLGIISFPVGVDHRHVSLVEICERLCEVCYATLFSCGPFVIILKPPFWRAVERRVI